MFSSANLKKLAVWSLIIIVGALIANPLLHGIAHVLDKVADIFPKVA